MLHMNHSELVFALIKQSGINGYTASMIRMTKAAATRKFTEIP